MGRKEGSGFCKELNPFLVVLEQPESFPEGGAEVAIVAIDRPKLFEQAHPSPCVL